MSHARAPIASLAPGVVEVWTVRLDPEGTASERLLAGLSPDEADHARRLGSLGAPWAQAHLALRGILALHLGLTGEQVRLTLGHGGKPELAPPATLRFSLSRTDGLALIAVSGDRAVGIDVERVHEGIDVRAVAAAFLPPGEIAAIELAPESSRRAAFFAAWTRVEARLKLTGEGLTGSPAHETPLMLVRAIPLESGYAASVAAEGGNWTVQRREWTGAV